MKPYSSSSFIYFYHQVLIKMHIEVFNVISVFNIVYKYKYEGITVLRKMIYFKSSVKKKNSQSLAKFGLKCFFLRHDLQLESEKFQLFVNKYYSQRVIISCRISQVFPTQRAIAVQVMGIFSQMIIRCHNFKWSITLIEAKSHKH